MKRISLRNTFALHLTILLPLSAFLSAGTLFAQDNDDLFRRADSLYVAGIELYNNADYLAAAALFEQCDSLNKAGEREEPYYSNNAKNWEGSAFYIARDTVRAMTADATGYMLRPVDQRLTVKSDSLYYMGNNYYEAGDFENAIKYFQMCAELEKEELGEDHYSYANSLSNIGFLHFNLGNIESALDFWEIALDIYTLDNYKNPMINTLLGNIAICSYNNGDYDKAIDYFTRSLDFTKENYGERSEDCLFPLSNLSGCYNRAGNYDMSIECGERTLALAEEIYGAGSHNYAWVLEILANDYYRLDDYEKAIELGTKAMEIQKEVLGDLHPDYAMSLAYLAYYYSHLGNYDKAMELGTEAMEIKKEALGYRHPN